MTDPTPAVEPIKCDCYPGGFSPETYEGPKQDCPVHGDSASEPISDERLAELQQQIADVISDNVKLMVLATNCTQDQFEKSWQGVRDALAQQATSIVAARIRQDAETIKQAEETIRVLDDHGRVERRLRLDAEEGLQQAERERDQLVLRIEELLVDPVTLLDQDCEAADVVTVEDLRAALAGGDSDE